MRKKGRTRSIAVLCLVAVAIAGCSVASPQPPPASPTPMPAAAVATETAVQIAEPTPLPFEGLWVTQGVDPAHAYQILVFTADSLYWVQTGNWANIASLEGKEGDIHEEFFEILSYDLALNHIRLRKLWVRNNGYSGGFDYNTGSLTYVIEADQLQMTLAASDEFPAEATSEPYFRK
ncbi:MAG: hypothetical protein E4G99_01260 [Anaerolineales bacterium]|nr:MAG: hypothetical protein E4G99_01260 [Anaerolineales bacterium]